MNFRYKEVPKTETNATLFKSKNKKIENVQSAKISSDIEAQRFDGYKDKKHTSSEIQAKSKFQSELAVFASFVTLGQDCYLVLRKIVLYYL